MCAKNAELTAGASIPSNRPGSDTDKKKHQLELWAQVRATYDYD